jgi:hypothetical protein
MTTLQELMESAAGEPAHPLDMERVHVRGQTLARQRSAARLAIPAVVVLIAAAAFLTIARPDDDGAVASFDLPPIGTAVGDYLADGTPVWIVHDEDGQMHVLGAENPASASVDPEPGMPINHTWAAGWCPTSQRFESLWGSMWDTDGAVLGGPAPLGLPRYPFTLADGVVTVTGNEALAGPVREYGEVRSLPTASNCYLQPPAAIHPEWAGLRVTPDTTPTPSD